ncbi:MAG TPA: serine/threonine-protein kinase [Polyangia bacterium]|jgi:serine/threonine-protein kinase
MKQPTDLRGAVLGRGYRLGRRLGDGDGSPVFEAAHERLPSKLVVRLFPAEALARLDGIARLQRGACFGSLLRTPQAIQILDFNLPGDSPAFVVTEWVEGRGLKAMMASDGMLSPVSTAEIVESIALALIAGHEQGLVHGDLHPAHVIIPEGARRAKVGGFGWAKELRAVASRPAPSGFLAPEQQFGKVLNVDARADQFALAALAYEMLAGCLPFPEESSEASSEATASTMTTRMPSPLGELVPGLPPALDDVIRRALSPSPADRFDDVLAFAARFKDAATGARAAIPAPIPVTAADRRSARIVASRPTTSRVPSALPTTPASDVTEEMDVRTLWPLVAKADSGGSGGNVSTRIQAEESLDLDLLTHVAREKGYDVEIEAEADSGEVDRRAGSASRGRRSVRRAPVVTAAVRPDDAETLIRRSPFSLPSVSPPPTRRSSPSVPSTVVSPAALMPSSPSSWPEDSDALDALSLEPRAPRPAATGTSGATFSTGTFPAPRARIPTLQHHPLVQPVQPRQSGFTNVGTWANVPTVDIESVRLRGSRKWTSAAWGVALLAALVGGGVLVKSRLPGGFGLKASSAAAPVAVVNTPDPSAPARPAVSAPAAAPPRDAAPIVAPVQPLPVEPPPPSRANGSGGCSMKIASTPSAEVWIDGEDTGHRTPLHKFKVSCGPHRLVLRPDSGTERVEFLKARPGHPIKGDYTLD